MGAEAVKDILKQLGIEPGCFTSDHCRDLDNSRIFYAEYKCNETLAILHNVDDRIMAVHDLHRQLARDVKKISQC